MACDIFESSIIYLLFLFYYQFQYPIYFLFPQLVMHGQADDAVGQLMGIGQILRAGTFQSTVGGKSAYQG